ncbi:MAG: polymer-forming cytoskeletal protein [Nitrospirae bacterium]|jgi:cytoskeletal protein CcmA (bactofilin family)|nr:polymer-forming cytoskeletal protein [Nitrospirota bacterium]
MKPIHGDTKQNNIIAFLGKETYFKGYLHFEGTVRIDGKLEGEIVSKDVLIIGEGANIKGDIKVQKVVCGGNVTGTIESTEAVQLVKPSNVHADIKTPVLSIEEGVIFNGNCRMETGFTTNEELSSNETTS